MEGGGWRVEGGGWRVERRGWSVSRHGAWSTSSDAQQALCVALHSSHLLRCLFCGCRRSTAAKSVLASSRDPIRAWQRPLLQEGVAV